MSLRTPLQGVKFPLVIEKLYTGIQNAVNMQLTIDFFC